MQRAILVSGFLLLASLLVAAQATMGTQAAPSAPPSTRTAGAATTPAPGNSGQTTGTTPTNTPQLTDTIGQPVGSTPTQTGTTTATTTTGTTTTGTTTTPNAPPPSSVPTGPIAGQGEIGAANTATSTSTGQAAGGQSAAAPAGQSATMPPQTDVNRSLTPAQVIGTGNFSLTGSVWSMSANQESLADASRVAKQKLAQDHPRVFTNNDIARLREAAGEPGLARPGSRPGLVTNEQTMPASDVTAPNASSPNSQNSPGVQNNLPASDQTTPPTNMNQNQRRPSPFRPKK